MREQDVTVDVLDRALLFPAVRKAISDAYYDARNAGETMETAATNATDAVLAEVDRVLSDPSR